MYYGYGGYGYGFDISYLVLVLPCILFSLWASSSVKSTFNRYSKVYSSRRITGAQAAQRVLSANGVTGVRIEQVRGNLTDHFACTTPHPWLLSASPATKPAMRFSMHSIMHPSSFAPPSFL